MTELSERLPASSTIAPPVLSRRTWAPQWAPLTTRETASKCSEGTRIERASGLSARSRAPLQAICSGSTSMNSPAKGRSVVLSPASAASFSRILSCTAGMPERCDSSDSISSQRTSSSLLMPCSSPMRASIFASLAFFRWAAPASSAAAASTSVRNSSAVGGRASPSSRAAASTLPRSRIARSRSCSRRAFSASQPAIWSPPLWRSRSSRSASVLRLATRSA